MQKLQYKSAKEINLKITKPFDLSVKQYLGSLKLIFIVRH